MGSQPGKSRLEFLDALRGFAILMVMINHAGSIAAVSGLLGKLTSYGAYGVQLFFVISAYTIFLTYKAYALKEETPVRNFFIRRLMRIVPVYWAGIVLYTLVYGLASRGWLPGPEYWHYPFHILLVNIWHPLTQSSIVPGGWSISVEVMFYLSVPLWIALVRNMRQAVLFAIISILLGASFAAGMKHLGVFDDFAAELMALYWHRTPLNQLGCFAIGICLYFAIRDGWQTKLRTPTRLLAAWGGAVALFILGLKWPFEVPADHHFFAAGFGLVGLALAASPFRLLVNRASIFVGKISYSAYLLHFLVLKQLTLLFPVATPSTGNFLLVTVLGVGLTLPLAWLSFRFVETPASNLGKKWIASRAGTTKALA